MASRRFSQGASEKERIAMTVHPLMKVKGLPGLYRAVQRCAYQLQELPMQYAKHGAFIYLLRNGEEVVYVGQTTRSVAARVSDHMYDKKFDRITYLEIPEEEQHLLGIFETQIISALQPELNARRPTY